jgi:hypothetical protein
VFRHHRYSLPVPSIVYPQGRSVRLLQNDEELQAAVERARAFERRTADHHQRRVGSYDRFLSDGSGRLSAVAVLVAEGIFTPESEIADNSA